MQCELSAEEQMLQEMVADYGRVHFGGANAPRSADVDWQTPWDAFAALGLTGILVPEKFGGSGGTLLDACLIAEQLGRADAWVPFVGSGIAAAAVLRSAADPDQGALADLAAGSVYSVLLDDRLRLPGATAALAFDWRDGARTVLATQTGEVTVDADPVIADLQVTDPLHPIARLVDPIDSQANAPASSARAIAEAAARVGVAAWLTGLAQVAMDDAVEYAKNREQFGAPIGSFQAIQHLCADMYFAVETCRSVFWGAAWAVENEPTAEAIRIAAAAKSWCSRKAVEVAQTSIQVFGGIGVTWEHPAHLRLRTAQQFARVFGSARELDETRGRHLLAGRTEGA